MAGEKEEKFVPRWDTIQVKSLVALGASVLLLCGTMTFAANNYPVFTVLGQSRCAKPRVINQNATIFEEVSSTYGTCPADAFGEESFEVQLFGQTLSVRRQTGIGESDYDITDATLLNDDYLVQYTNNGQGSNLTFIEEE